MPDVPIIRSVVPAAAEDNRKLLLEIDFEFIAFSGTPWFPLFSGSADGFGGFSVCALDFNQQVIV
jgi:hypothetical protein